MKNPKILWQELWKSSIRRQLVFGVALVHLILMSIFVFDLTERQKQFLQKKTINDTTMQAEILAQSITPWFLSDDLAEVQAIVSDFSRDKQIRYTMIVDLQGHILGHSDTGKVGKYLQDMVSLSIFKHNKTFVLFDEKNSMELAAPIFQNNSVHGWVIISKDKSADLAYITYVTSKGILYTLAAIAIGTVFALLLSQRILRQLNLLLLGTKNLAEEKLDASIPIISHNEIAEVAESFNYALAKIKEQKKTLQLDLQERLRFEKTIKENFFLLHSIINSSNSSIFSVDSNYKYTSFNIAHAATMQALFKIKIAIGTSILDYISAENDKIIIQSNLQRALRGEQFSRELYFGDEKLARLCFEISHNPIITVDNKIIGVAVFAKDLSEIKDIEQLLHESEEQIKSLKNCEKNLEQNISTYFFGQSSKRINLAP